jgi:hypothetical protein
MERGGYLRLVCILTWLSTAGATLLPVIILDQTHISPFVIYPVLLTIVILAAGLVVLAIQRRSVLDDWLMVVALVAILYQVPLIRTAVPNQNRCAQSRNPIDIMVQG